MVSIPVQRTAVEGRERSEDAVAVEKSAVGCAYRAAGLSVHEDHACRLALAPGLARKNQTLRKTSVPFVPPNPKEFDIATSIFMGRAVLGT